MHGPQVFAPPADRRPTRKGPVMNPSTTLLNETAGYLHADDILNWASSPGQRIAIAAALLRKVPVHGTAWEDGFRLRFEDELLSSPAVQ